MDLVVAVEGAAELVVAVDAPEAGLASVVAAGQEAARVELAAAADPGAVRVAVPEDREAARVVSVAPADPELGVAAWESEADRESALAVSAVRGDPESEPGALVDLPVELAYYPVRVRDDRGSGSVVSVDQVTVPGITALGATMWDSGTIIRRPGAGAQGW
ncbi:MAG: hypothetical protein ACT4QC_05935 [Planctomycetaceae bacterium]